MTVVTVVLVTLLAAALVAVAWLTREVKAYKILLEDAWAREDEEDGYDDPEYAVERDHRWPHKPGQTTPPDTDLSRFPPPRPGEPWSIIRNGVHMDGIGPFDFEKPGAEAKDDKQPQLNAARRAARNRPRRRPSSRR